MGLWFTKSPAFSFDKATKQLFAGDAGQNKYEEVDIIINKGGNYGWRARECFHNCDLQNSASKTDLVDPIYEYEHEQGISTQGDMFTAVKLFPVKGKYVYGDDNAKCGY